MSYHHRIDSIEFSDYKKWMKTANGAHLSLLKSVTTSWKSRPSYCNIVFAINLHPSNVSTGTRIYKYRITLLCVSPKPVALCTWVLGYVIVVVVRVSEFNLSKWRHGNSVWTKFGISCYEAKTIWWVILVERCYQALFYSLLIFGVQFLFRRILSKRSAPLITQCNLLTGHNCSITTTTCLQ